MSEWFLSNRKVQSFVRLVTALSFAFFTAYQIYTAMQTASNRTGRLIGVCLYLTITLAAFFSFSYSPRLQNARSIMMLVSLSLLFMIRLINLPALLRNPVFANLPSFLNFAAYVLPQIGTVVITVMWVRRRRPFVTVKAIAPLIPVVIAIYALCFAAECVLMICYRMNVDGSLKLALLSRLMYFAGFSGTTFIFFFNDPAKPFEPEVIVV